MVALPGPSMHGLGFYRAPELGQPARRLSSLSRSSGDQPFMGSSSIARPARAIGERWALRDGDRCPSWLFGVIGPVTGHALAGVRIPRGVVPLGGRACLCNSCKTTRVLRPFCWWRIARSSNHRQWGLGFGEGIQGAGVSTACSGRNIHTRPGSGRRTGFCCRCCCHTPDIQTSQDPRRRSPAGRGY